MSFILKPIDEVSLKLDIKEPCGVGEYKNHDLVVTWVYLPGPELKQLNEEIEAEQKRMVQAAEALKEGQEMPELKITDRSMCERLIKNIQGLLTADGKEIPYQPELIEQLLNMNYVAVPLLEQLGTVISGQAGLEALAKN